ncbi:alpha/beta hydrolase [Alkalicoccus urumqiensis]|uniref:Alpha/beta hydrolase n=2 Tax=Alkalicoccus urumqiensis TaxID=1548213 RepID=A0A2P6MK48_ALKUR|nr:alpha/beta hydrolase [Alkalicoccus urumqiensis]
MRCTYSSSNGFVRYGVSGSGPPLVLIHGTPWSSFNWRHIIPGLSEFFTVYYYDLLGYGKSEKPEGDVSLGVQHDLFKALLNEWQLEEPIVIGHDFGGTTALRTHLLHGVPYKKLVLIDPVAIGPWGSPFFTHVNQYEAAFRGLPDAMHEALVSTYVQGAMYQPMPEDTRRGILHPWLGSTGRPAFYRQIAQARQRYTDEIEPLYASIRMPTLILWGREDEWIPVEKGRALHSRIPGASFCIIPDAGHLVQEDQPAVLLGKLLPFLLA